MAHTYDLGTDAGLVRLNLSDTVEATAAFTDAEIASLLTTHGSVTAATGAALRILLADRARRCKSFSLPGMSYNDTAALASLRDLLSLYGADLPTATVRMGAVMDTDRGFIDPLPTVY